MRFFNDLGVEHSLTQNLIRLNGIVIPLSHQLRGTVPPERGESMKHLSTAEIAVIKARILRGDKYAEIAADYRINQGRIADLKFGRIYADVLPADLSLPDARPPQGRPFRSVSP